MHQRRAPGRRTALLLGSVALSFMTACSSAANAPVEIAAFNKAYDAAILSQDNARVLALWESDGVSLLPGLDAVRGREALGKFLAQVQAQTLGWKVIAEESTCHDLLVSGEWATEWCETHQAATRPGGQPNWEGWGKMAVVLHRQQGQWLLRQEMWTQGPAPQAQHTL